MSQCGSEECSQEVGKTDNWECVKAKSISALPKEVVDAINEALAGPHAESKLIAILHRLQGINGFLGKEEMSAVAQLMQIPEAKVTGVATFYHFFRLTPRGKYLINVCLGTACYVNGADKVADKFREELGVDFGQTTADKLFSLEKAACLGTCGLAPVVMINDEVHAKMTPEKVSALIAKLTQENIPVKN